MATIYRNNSVEAYRQAEADLAALQDEQRRRTIDLDTASEQEVAEFNRWSADWRNRYQEAERRVRATSIKAGAAVPTPKQAAEAKARLEEARVTARKTGKTIKSGYTTIAQRQAAEAAKSPAQKQFEKENTQVKDGNWIDNKYLADLKDSNPTIYKILVDQGIDAANARIKEENIRIQQAKYSERGRYYIETAQKAKTAREKAQQSEYSRIGQSYIQKAKEVQTAKSQSIIPQPGDSQEIKESKSRLQELMAILGGFVGQFSTKEKTRATIRSIQPKTKTKTQDLIADARANPSKYIEGAVFTFVPGIYTATHWKDMSQREKSFSIAADTALLGGIIMAWAVTAPSSSMSRFSGSPKSVKAAVKDAADFEKMARAEAKKYLSAKELKAIENIRKAMVTRQAEDIIEASRGIRDLGAKGKINPSVADDIARRVEGNGLESLKTQKEFSVATKTKVKALDKQTRTLEELMAEKPKAVPKTKTPQRTKPYIAPRKEPVPSEEYGRMTQEQIKRYYSEEASSDMARIVGQPLPGTNMRVITIGKTATRISEATSVKFAETTEAATREAIALQEKVAAGQLTQAQVRERVGELVRAEIKPVVKAMTEAQVKQLAKVVTRGAIKQARKPEVKTRLRAELPIAGSGATSTESRRILKTKRGLLGWRQGQLGDKDIWHVITEPYKSKKDHYVVIGRRPEGSRLIVVRGAGSAGRTAFFRGKKPSRALMVDMGITDVDIKPTSSGIKITFSGDPRQKTTGDINIGGNNSSPSKGESVFPLEKGERV